MKIINRKYNFNENGLYLTIWAEHIELYTHRYSTSIQSTVFYDEITVDEEHMQVSLLDELEKLIAVIYNLNRITDMR